MGVEILTLIKVDKTVLFKPQTAHHKQQAQHTLRHAISFSGIGVHSGTVAHVRLEPAPANSGVQFIRSDIKENNLIIARYDNVAETRLCTVIANEHKVSVATIEHLCAALAACGIDNVLVQIDGPEMPILDGSSAPFVALIAEAGLVAQAAPRRWLEVLYPVSIQDGQKTAQFLPSAESRFTVDIDFAAPAIGRQHYSLALSSKNFMRDIAPARTFALKAEIEALQKAGFGRGGSLDNAVVIDDAQVLNDGGFRFADECVRHKVLDAVGDIYLAGGPILGHFIGNQCGHGLNNKLLRALFAEARNYRWVTNPVPLMAQESATIHEPLYQMA